jgi:dihydrofolate reductase
MIRAVRNKDAGIPEEAAMQTLTVDVFLSVDGWAGSATSPGYFGYFGPELEEWITDELALPQLVVLGRRTYEALAGLPKEARDESSQRMAELNKVVFSRTMDTVSWPNTHICHDDATTEVTRLKANGNVPLRTMGSLSVARQLLAADTSPEPNRSRAFVKPSVIWPHRLRR